MFAPNPHANYDVMPDGRHFVFLEPAGTGDMIVTANWWTRARARLGY